MKPRLQLLACVGAPAILAACVADKNERAARKPPPDASPERLVLAVDGKFHDTDANGYGDTVQVFAYLFGDMRYELPLEAPGSFEFRLVNPDGSVLRTWSFDQTQVAERLGRSPVGPGYQFVLNLREGGTDVLEPADVELTAAFMPPRGEAVRSRVDAPITVGRVRPLGATGWRAEPAR